MHHTTRRKVVFTSVPGSFKWRCPDCSGVWEQATVDRGADRAAASVPPADLTVDVTADLTADVTADRTVDLTGQPAATA